jgi:hypothetical protein
MEDEEDVVQRKLPSSVVYSRRTEPSTPHTLLFSTENNQPSLLPPLHSQYGRHGALNDAAFEKALN